MIGQICMLFIVSAATRASWASGLPSSCTDSHSTIFYLHSQCLVPQRGYMREFKCRLHHVRTHYGTIGTPVPYYGNTRNDYVHLYRLCIGFPSASPFLSLSIIPMNGS
jgi:hypothetical protein